MDRHDRLSKYLSLSNIYDIYISYMYHSIMLTESESEVSQSSLTLCDPMDCSPQGSFIHGISQARVLEWVAISFSRRSSRPRD